MRLLVIEPHPYFGGGMEAVSLRLSRELAARGHQIVLVHESEGTMLDAYRMFAELVIKMKLPGFPLRQPVATITQLWRLLKLIRRHRIDRVFSSHLQFMRVGAVIKVLTGVPSFFHLGLHADGTPVSVRFCLRWIGGGISPAQHTLESWAEASWPEERLWLVRNWVDGDEFHPVNDQAALRRELDLPENVFLIGYVGRIVREKGVEVLVEAFNRVAGDLQTCQLVMVGIVEEDYRDSLISRCAAPDRLSIMPRTDQPQKVLAALNLVCVPSIWDEPFPLALLEAMASAVPAITSDKGVLPEILGDRDWVAEAGDVEALAALIKFAVTNTAVTNAHGAALRTRALSILGPEEAVSAYERIILGTEIPGTITGIDL